MPRTNRSPNARDQNAEHGVASDQELAAVQQDLDLRLFELSQKLLERIEQRFDSLESMLTQKLSEALSSLPSGPASATNSRQAPTIPADIDQEHAETLRAFHERMREASQPGSTAAHRDRSQAGPSPTSRLDSDDEMHDLHLLERRIAQNGTPSEVDQIQLLKEQLESMLRETEIELSIERAKITQQRAELEEKAMDLARRERELLRRAESQRGQRDPAGGMLSRMKHFLTPRRNDTPNRESEGGE